MYQYFYQTPNGFGNMIMNSDGHSLTALCFEDSRDVAKVNTDCETKLLPVFEETCRWLEQYFSGKTPDFTPAYTILNLTPFRKRVTECMLEIPYGHTVTYKAIAERLAGESPSRKMSAQAVGGAVGRNPIGIIVPCHRVVGANGSLTGYGGGIENKYMLLQSEGNDMRQFSVPQRFSSH